MASILNQRFSSICRHSLSNPILHSINNYCSPFSILSRSATKQAFERTKEHCNVGTIGHVDHGKTTLSSAITKVLTLRKKEGDKAEYIAYNKIDSAVEEVKRGITIKASTIEYETGKRHYSHHDCPGHRDYIKNMITGAAQLETAILVVAATDGVAPQTKEHILLAKQIGIPNIVVFINKCDEEKDPELLQIVEMEVKDLLTAYDFDVNKIPFIRGSALAALKETDEAIGKEAISQLLDELDKSVIPPRNDDLPFMMPVDQVLHLKGVGCVVTGRVERGRVKIGDTVEIVGLQKPQTTTVTGVEMFQKPVKQGQSGDNLGICLRGIAKDALKRGQYVVAPKSETPKQSFKAQCYFLMAEEGGRSKPVKSGYQPQFFMKTSNISGTITTPSDREVIMPGDNAEINVTLQYPNIIYPQLRFAMREGGNTVAVGVITEAT